MDLEATKKELSHQIDRLKYVGNHPGFLRQIRAAHEDAVAALHAEPGEIPCDEREKLVDAWSARIASLSTRILEADIEIERICNSASMPAANSIPCAVNEQRSGIFTEENQAIVDHAVASGFIAPQERPHRIY